MVWDLGSDSWSCNPDQEMQNRNQKRDFQLNVEIKITCFLIVFPTTASIICRLLLHRGFNCFPAAASSLPQAALLGLFFTV